MRQIDGHQIDRLKARFSGTLDEVDEDEFRFDRLVVMLVTVRTEIGGVRPMDDGEVVGTMALKVQHAVPLTGDIRERAVSYMADPNQGLMDFGQKVVKPRPPAIEGQGDLADYATPPTPTNVDPDTGEIEPEVFDVPVATPPVRPEPAEALSPENGQAPPPVGQRVGSIYGRQRKDSVLDSFLNE